MLIEIRHEKPLGKRFDVYYGDTLLEGGEEYDIPTEGVALRFVERNPAVGKRWPLLLLGHFLASLFGAPDSLQEIGRSRTEICVDLGKVEGDELSIVFLEGGKSYRIEGAPKAAERSRQEVPLPQVERRIRGYQIGVIALVLALLAAAIVLCVRAA